jgi:methylated-DNA-[protein]-cysteine S-methyltransferase
MERPAMPPLYHTIHATPAGSVLLLGHDHALTGLHFVGGRHVPELRAECQAMAKPFDEARRQLDAYFAGARRQPYRFDLPLDVAGTPFQQEVWSALRAIPFGQSTSYGALAQQLGRPSAARAIGAAVGRNPVSIIIPCHRVLGSSGALTGYAGGLLAKRCLLALEGISAAADVAE